MDHLAEKQGINLTPEALQAMIAAAVTAAIQESRKPAPPTEQELSALAMKQEHRAKTAESVVAAIEGTRRMQEMCVHEHSRREGGGTHCVWVREEDPRSPGFILCQKCQGRIRPGAYDKDGHSSLRDRGAIFNTDLFNKLFQECGEATLMG